MKQYIGISRDHSGSMGSLRKGAMNDYNQTVDAIRDASNKQGIDTIISTVKNGVGSAGRVEREVVNSSINALKPITTYSTDGGSTPLFDSILELIELLESAPDKDEAEVSFLVMAITDGHENSSKRIRGPALGERIRKLQATDKWTFIFRVPRGYSKPLENLGIPSGNILEWDQSERGLAASTEATKQAFNAFYENRSSGIRASKTFYANLSDVKPEDLKRELTDITKEVDIMQATHKSRIDDLVQRNGITYVKGNAFYQLTKHEKDVQDYKKIVLRDRNTGKVYGGGQTARHMLGLPNYGTVSLSPGDHKNYEIFIQSTSMNRNIPENAKVLYWDRVR